jgi:transposase
VRFFLTAGQAGDAPHAAPLVDGLPAEAVIADTAYDADAFRQVIADKQARAVIPNNPSRTKKESPRCSPLCSPLCPAPPRRVLLQQAQTVPPRRHPLRENRQKLSRRHHYRSYRAMDQIIVHTT